MQPQKPVTIVASRFEDLVSRGLRALVDEDRSLALVAHDVEIDAMAAAIGEHEPRVAVVNYGSLRAPAEVHTLHMAHPHTRLMVLANRPTEAECNQMLAFGATACLSKQTQGRDILNAMHLASRGLHVLPRTRAELTPVDAGPDLLTPREADVLELLQMGRSNAEIAQSLTIGIETVRTHARNVFRKLGVGSRRELLGLIDVRSTLSVR